MEWVVLVLAVIAAAASAVGAKQTADAQEKAANYSAQANKQNAEAAAQQGAFDADQIREKNKRVIAAQRTQWSASGIDPDSATATDVRADSAAQGEMDALIALYTGRSSANANIARSRLNEMEARSAANAGKMGVATSLLGGAVNATSAYKKSNPSF